MSLSRFIWDEHCPRCGNIIDAFRDRIREERELRCCKSCGLRVKTQINKTQQSRFFLYAVVYIILIIFLPNLISAILTVGFIGLSSYKTFQWEMVSEE